MTTQLEDDLDVAEIRGVLDKITTRMKHKGKYIVTTATILDPKTGGIRTIVAMNGNYQILGDTTLSITNIFNKIIAQIAQQKETGPAQSSPPKDAGGLKSIPSEVATPPTDQPKGQ